MSLRRGARLSTRNPLSTIIAISGVSGFAMPDSSKVSLSLMDPTCTDTYVIAPRDAMQIVSLDATLEPREDGVLRDVSVQAKFHLCVRESNKKSRKGEL